MKAIESYIESKQNEFIDHEFFAKLNQLTTLEEIKYFVPELTFWARLRPYTAVNSVW